MIEQPGRQPTTVQPGSSIARWVEAGILFCLFAGVYLLTLLRFHTYDALVYSNSAVSGFGSISELLHPHHLGWHVLSRYAYLIGTALGWSGEPAFPLQVMNALFGAATIALVHALLRVVLDRWAAFLTSALLGVSATVWFHSVEVEVYIVGSFFLVLLASLVFRLDSRNLTQAGTLGLLVAIATLSHQTNILIVPAVLAAIAIDKRSASRTRVVYSLVLIVVAGILVAGSYLAATFALGITSFKGIAYWTTLYSHIDAPWGVLTLKTPFQALRGFQEAILDWEHRILSILLGGLLTLGLVAISVKAYRANPRVVTFLLSWIIVFRLFFTWWEPENVEFWVAVLPACVLMFGYALASFRPVNLRRALPALALAGAFLGVVNIPNGAPWSQPPAPTSEMEAVRALGQRVIPGDLIVTTFKLSPWLTYYTEADALPFQREFIKAAMRGAADVGREGLAANGRMIDETLAEGKTVWVIEDAVEEDLGLYGIEPAALRSFYASWVLIPTEVSFRATYLNSAPTLRVFTLTRR